MKFISSYIFSFLTIKIHVIGLSFISSITFLKKIIIALLYLKPKQKHQNHIEIIM